MEMQEAVEMYGMLGNIAKHREMMRNGKEIYRKTWKYENDAGTHAIWKTRAKPCRLDCGPCDLLICALGIQNQIERGGHTQKTGRTIR